MTKSITVAVAGNPNSGKTTLFNALTGLRQKIANYPGVTVEKKEGFLTLPQSGQSVKVLDLPGAYSLLTRSPDEDVVHQVIIGRQAGTPAPDLLVIVVDASNLERNLFFVTQLLETGIPAILVMNMWDIVFKKRTIIDLQKLAAALNTPIIPTVGNRANGVRELKAMIEKRLHDSPVTDAKPFQIALPIPVETEIAKISAALNQTSPDLSREKLRGEAIRLLGDNQFRNPFFKSNTGLKETVQQAVHELNSVGLDALSVDAEARYAYVNQLCSEIIQSDGVASDSLSDKLDRVFTHKFWGFIVFFGLMCLVFQSIFSWASVPMNMLDSVVSTLGQWAGRALPEGQLNSLVVDGVIAGVGGVIIFLPQICFLFFFISLFEDSGYMARAAFVLDRLMRKVGLSGKSFIPLLSSFACAIPGIMSTRTIEDRNDRLATILVAPLMSCSARLPVYALMISAFIPPVKVWGIFNLQGITLFSMYTLSISMGLGIATLFRKTLLKGNTTPFVLELPPYRMPNLRTVMMTMWEKASQFLYRAGTIIFTLSIVLWFLVSYPRHNDTTAKFQAARQTAEQSYSGTELETRVAEINNQEKSVRIRESFAGSMGHWIEPVVKPLGFDWKIGIGLIASFAAREVLVSTLSIVYSVGDDSGEESKLAQRLRMEKSPETGKPVYSPLVAVSVMVFFVLACQCISTVAIVKRETNSWRWPAFMVLYMTVLAWCGSFTVYQLGTRMGF